MVDDLLGFDFISTTTLVAKRKLCAKPIGFYRIYDFDWVQVALILSCRTQCSSSPVSSFSRVSLISPVSRVSCPKYHCDDDDNFICRTKVEFLRLTPYKKFAVVIKEPEFSQKETEAGCFPYYCLFNI